MNFKGKSFLTLADFEPKEIEYLINLAHSLKQDKQINREHKLLKDKTLIMIFTKPSLRTRVSFEVGIQELGGNAVVLKQDEINLGVRETIADTARVLSRYADGVMIRTFDHSDVVEFSQVATIPVINALTDSTHPCQVLADLLTIKEHFGSFKNLKIAYVGDGNNMTQSLLLGSALVGMDISVGCPNDYRAEEFYISKAREIAEKTGSKISITDNAQEAAKNADIIYGDVWASMGQEEEAEERKKIFSSYQINKELIKNANKDCIVMHCLPAHRGEEITNEILEAHANTIFEQAENRLHAQKAIMASIM